MAYRFKRRESVSSGVKRILTEQSVKATNELSASNLDSQDSVHNARKCFKRIRSLLRLVHPELGDDIYCKENKWFADAGRQLSVVRDAEALIETLDKLVLWYPEIKEHKSQVRLRSRLVEQCQDIADTEQDLDEQAKALSLALKSIPSRVEKWTLAHKGFSALSPGFEQCYRDGREAMKQVYKNPSNDNSHEWRKRVIDHWNHCRLLGPISPELMRGRISQLKELAGLLGDNHDLTALKQYLSAKTQKAKSNAYLLGYIEEHQPFLERHAYKIGRKIYEEKPSRLADDMTKYWDAWHKSGSSTRISGKGD